MTQWLVHLYDVIQMVIGLIYFVFSPVEERMCCTELLREFMYYSFSLHFVYTKMKYTYFLETLFLTYVKFVLKN